MLQLAIITGSASVVFGGGVWQAAKAQNAIAATGLAVIGITATAAALFFGHLSV